MSIGTDVQTMPCEPVIRSSHATKIIGGFPVDFDFALVKRDGEVNLTVAAAPHDFLRRLKPGADAFRDWMTEIGYDGIESEVDPRGRRLTIRCHAMDSELFHTLVLDRLAGYLERAWQDHQSFPLQRTAGV